MELRFGSAPRAHVEVRFDILVDLPPLPEQRFEDIVVYRGSTHNFEFLLKAEQAALRRIGIHLSVYQFPPARPPILPNARLSSHLSKTRRTSGSFAFLSSGGFHVQFSVRSFFKHGFSA